MKPLILAIDNSKAIRFLLQSVLGKNFQLVTVPDAASALHFLSKKEFPALILADAKLPDTENWELLTNLKNSYIYRDIPTIVLSSLSMEQTEANCKSLEIEKYFLKPFNPLHLVEAIEELLATAEEPLANYMRAI